MEEYRRHTFKEKGFLMESTSSLEEICWAVGHIIHFLVDPVVLIDRNGEVRAGNRAFLELLGYTEAELKGRAFDGLCRLPSREESLTMLLKRYGSVRELDMGLRTKDGRDIPVSFSVSPVVSNDTSVIYIGIARDRREDLRLLKELEGTKDELKRRIDALEEFREGILYMLHDLDRNENELEEIRRRLKETQEQLFQSSKLKVLGEIAAGLAHELNQPLTVIRGLSQNLLRKTSPRDQDYEKLKLMVDASRRMEEIINHLRVFSRMDEPEFRIIDLNDVIRNTLKMVKELLARHSIEIRLSLSPLPPIRGCANKLEQVIINLATNARDAMPDGGVLSISTRTVDDNGRRYAEVTVSDTGYGIPDDIIHRIFDPFFTTKEEGKGTGLGLSISYSIIKDHRGEIKVRSKKDKGTIFFIRLPTT